MELQEHYEGIRELGAELVAISADDVQGARLAVVGLELDYPVVPDPDREIIRAYGLLHPQEGISRPAVLVVDPQGQVRHRYVGRHAADRPAAEQVLGWLREVVAG